MMIKFPATRIAATFLLATTCFSLTSTAYAVDTPKDASLERGRNLIRLGGCADCHTNGYDESGGQLPEAQWLTGSSLGYKGPWGTTYAPNLRTLARSMSADQWVAMSHTIKTRPPMPWFLLHQMSEADLRAMHAFITSLGPSDSVAPQFLPPGVEPRTPHWSLTIPVGH